jgi:hypothetical protein
MPCSICHSHSQSEFATEMCVHFPGRENLEKNLLLFTSVTVCLDCGSTNFSIPQTDLPLFAKDEAIIQGRKGFAILPPRSARAA